MSETEDEDNIVYLDRKPGFYRRGPLQFKLYFGTIDELGETAEEEPKPFPAEEPEHPE